MSTCHKTCVHTHTHTQRLTTNHIQHARAGKIHAAFKCHCYECAWADASPARTAMCVRACMRSIACLTRVFATSKCIARRTKNSEKGAHECGHNGVVDKHHSAQLVTFCRARYLLECGAESVCVCLSAMGLFCELLVVMKGGG